MKALLFLLLAGLPWPCLAAVGTFPAASEVLDYAINWPSGLSLGEGHLKATLNQTGSWEFDFTAEAAFPGFPLKDEYKAAASSELCSANLSKDFRHGSRHNTETTTFSGHTATRKTSSGGKAELTVPDCAKDALTFVYFVRRELSHGKVPPAQEVLFGARYSIQLTYQGSANIPLAGASVVTDRMLVKGRGPASNFQAEIYFARDAARTPLLVKVPSALGPFSMELTR